MKYQVPGSNQNEMKNNTKKEVSWNNKQSEKHKSQYVKKKQNKKAVNNKEKMSKNDFKLIGFNKIKHS